MACGMEWHVGILHGVRVVCVLVDPVHGDALFEQEKGIWWMPWHQEAMKDVARCENPG